jgi:hypothetical protein
MGDGDEVRNRSRVTVQSGDFELNCQMNWGADSCDPLQRKTRHRLPLSPTLLQDFVPVAQGIPPEGSTAFFESFGRTLGFLQSHANRF